MIKLKYEGKKMELYKLEQLIKRDSSRYDYNSIKHCDEAFSILYKVEKFIKENNDKVSFIRIDTTSRVSNDIIYGGKEYNQLFLGVACFDTNRKHSPDLSNICFKSFKGFTLLNWKYMEMSHGQTKKIDISMDNQGLIELAKLFIGEERYKTVEYEDLKRELNKSKEQKVEKKIKL